ncbi:YajC Preprotein translocase subunit YajC [Candidatus Methylopumilus planktonicus]|jgi:preprotein translocase subunit YajC|uniref:preprotein translocase subunit YajC n=1 Tax=Candidatus Methylopumilus planktonicus TaxID=1581557 RepID=UPI003BEED9D5
MFISYAYAADAVPTDLMSFLPFIIIFVLFYFMLIRPQMKQAKAHKLMIDSLKKDDEIVTNGGLLGKVVKIKDQYVTIEIAASTQIHIQKQSVITLLAKGTIKSI